MSEKLLKLSSARDIINNLLKEETNQYKIESLNLVLGLIEREITEEIIDTAY